MLRIAYIAEDKPAEKRQTKKQAIQEMAVEGLAQVRFADRQKAQAKYAAALNAIQEKQNYLAILKARIK